MPVNQIEQGEKIDPYDIDEMPVQADGFDRGIVTCRESAVERLPKQPNKKSCADHHVKSVEAGHGEVQREVELCVSVEGNQSALRILRVLGAEGFLDFLPFGREFLGIVSRRRMINAVCNIKRTPGNQMVVILLFIFDVLDAQKDAAQNQGEHQENGKQVLAACLCRPDRHSHGETAGDEHKSVCGTQGQVEHITADAESGEVVVPVNSVGKEHAAEEQNFGGQKDPHAERGSFFLLLERFKLSVQLSGAVHSVLLFAIRGLASVSA